MTLDLIALLIAVPVVPACAYLLLLTALSGVLRSPPRSSRRLRFDVIVPAHDEALVIERTVQSLKRMDWPEELFRVLVIADNCNDATATIARSAGATVLERRDPDRRGKGFALAFAFENSERRGFADALFVVDADTSVSANALEACAARIEQGMLAVQVHDGVLNAAESWRTRLMSIAMTAFHTVRSRGRARLGLSCGIRGNGWCVSRQVLARVPYGAFSLAEDIEYGIALGRAGIAVAYAEEASSLAEMVSAEASARKQRARWEVGRLQLMRSEAIPLLLAAVRGRSAVCLDLALDLLVLPLSYILAGVLLLAGIGGVASLIDRSSNAVIWTSAGCFAALLLHVLRAWHLSGVGLRGLLDFARVPGFMLWKMILLARVPRPRSWVRTDRTSAR